MMPLIRCRTMDNSVRSTTLGSHRSRKPMGGARPPGLVNCNESQGRCVYRPKVMEKTTFSRLYFKGRFPMKRFVVLVLMGALSVAGETSLAFGQNAHPQPGSNPQAKKAQPPSAHAKRPPNKSPAKVKKSAPQAQ